MWHIGHRSWKIFVFSESDLVDNVDETENVTHREQDRQNTKPSIIVAYYLKCSIIFFGGNDGNVKQKRQSTHTSDSIRVITFPIFYLCLFYHPFYMYLTNTFRYLECHFSGLHWNCWFVSIRWSIWVFWGNISGNINVLYDYQTLICVFCFIFLYVYISSLFVASNIFSKIGKTQCSCWMYNFTYFGCTILFAITKLIN